MISTILQILTATAVRDVTVWADDLFGIVPSMGLSGQAWCFPLPICWGNAIPSWNVPSGKKFLLAAAPQVPAHDCPTPGAAAMRTHSSFLTACHPQISPQFFQPAGIHILPPFFQLLTELLALNLEQSCCFLQNHSWRNHNPGQVHFCPRAHPDNFISPHIFTKAGQQEFHLGLCSPASFPPHPKSHQQRDGLTEPQHRGIPCCHSSGMEGQGWTLPLKPRAEHHLHSATTSAAFPVQPLLWCCWKIPCVRKEGKIQYLLPSPLCLFHQGHAFIPIGSKPWIQMCAWGKTVIGSFSPFFSPWAEEGKVLLCLFPIPRVF